MPKKKYENIDGLGPRDIKNLRSAIRQVWHRSHVRKLVVKRCTDSEGFAFCEDCFERTPQLKIDHIVAVGELTGDYIGRMFVPSDKLQGLCKKCHDAKTKMERVELRKIAKRKKVK